MLGYIMVAKNCVPFNVRGHEEPIFAMTCRGGKLYSTGRDMSIKVWDTEDVTKGCIATLKGHTDVVCLIVYLQ